MKVAIIGAGLSGLIAARDLTQGGAAVTLFDKGRHVGGRCATRSTDIGHLDHGLQLLDGNDPRLIAALERVSCDVEAIQFDTGAYQPIPSPGPYLRLTHGARTFAEALAKDLDVKTSHSVTSCKWLHNAWSVQCGDTVFDAFDALVMAIPPAQAAVFNLHDDALDLGKSIYSPQVAALIADAEALDLPRTGPLPQDGLAWISKSADGKRATILSSEPLSSELMTEEKDKIAYHLWSLTGAKGQPAYLKGHRWRYCRVTQPLQKTHHWYEERRIGYCGDWFLGPCAGDALESGACLAKAMLGS